MLHCACDRVVLWWVRCCGAAVVVLWWVRCCSAPVIVLWWGMVLRYGCGCVEMCSIRRNTPVLKDKPLPQPYKKWTSKIIFFNI